MVGEVKNQYEMRRNAFTRSLQRGVSAVEYIVLMGVIAVAVIAFVIVIGEEVEDSFWAVTGGPTNPTTVADDTPSCDPQQYNVSECTPFHEAIDDCDVESLAVGEACPGTILVYAGPINGTRFYTYNPLLSGLRPPGYNGDPELAWDSVDANSGNFYAVGYGGNARNHIDIINHPRAHPAADYCESMGSYLPSPEQMDLMEQNAAALGFPQNPGRIYQTSSQYWPGFGGFNPAPIGEPLNYAFLNTMDGTSIGAFQHGFVTHEFFVRCITDLRNLYEDESLYLYGTAGDDSNLQLTGQLGAFGLEGTDTLRGTYRAEILNGGPGNDQLFGGSGNDIYVFEAGFGTDTIDDGGNTDIIEFRGLNSTDFIARTTGSSQRDIRFTHSDGSSVTVVGMRYVSSSDLMEGLEFADTGRLSAQEMRTFVVNSQQSAGLVRGFYQNDNYTYTLGGPSFDVQEYGGTDTFTFTDSASTEWRFENTGRDLTMYHAGTGAYITIIDQFYVSNNDYIENFVFTDTSLNRQGSINKAAEDMVAAGGSLEGSYGNDTYTIYPSSASFTLQERGGTDAFIFPDTASTDWTFDSTGRDMILRNIATGLNIRIYDQYYVSSNEYVESFQFTDQTFTRVGTIPKAHEDQKGTGTLVGTYADDTYEFRSTDGSFTIFENDNAGNVINFPDTSWTDYGVELINGRDQRLTYLPTGARITFDNNFYLSNADDVGIFNFTDRSMNNDAWASEYANRAALTGNVLGTYRNDIIDHTTGDGGFFWQEQYGSGDTLNIDTNFAEWSLSYNGDNIVLQHTGGTATGDRIEIRRFTNNWGFNSTVDFVNFADQNFTRSGLNAAAP
ncbi:MAG: hypothetical protein Alpg2KO_16970 [Alphaproteobacteria bacterium]